MCDRGQRRVRHGRRQRYQRNGRDWAGDRSCQQTGGAGGDRFRNAGRRSAAVGRQRILRRRRVVGGRGGRLLHPVRGRRSDGDGAGGACRDAFVVGGARGGGGGRQLLGDRRDRGIQLRQHDRDPDENSVPHRRLRRAAQGHRPGSGSARSRGRNACCHPVSTGTTWREPGSSPTTRRCCRGAR